LKEAHALRTDRWSAMCRLRGCRARFPRRTGKWAHKRGRLSTCARARIAPAEGSHHVDAEGTFNTCPQCRSGVAIWSQPPGLSDRRPGRGASLSHDQLATYGSADAPRTRNAERRSVRGSGESPAPVPAGRFAALWTGQGSPPSHRAGRARIAHADGYSHRNIQMLPVAPPPFTPMQSASGCRHRERLQEPRETCPRPPVEDPTTISERDFWVLECPERGTSERFIVFRDRAEAIDFGPISWLPSTTTGRIRSGTGGTAGAEAINDGWTASPIPTARLPRYGAAQCAAS
jgi:hypothetical protein